MALTSVQTLYSPESEGEVIQLLGKHEDSALIIAGGTFLHGLSSRGLLVGIEALIDIHNLPLDTIRLDDQVLSLGATVKFAQLQAALESLNKPWPGALLDALEYPPIQILNSATIGGCIASSCPFFDLPVSFMALNGMVEVIGPEGGRDVPLDELYTGLFETALDPNEFIKGIRFQVPDANTVSAFIKLETNANDLAILNLAISISLDNSGACAGVRAFAGGGVGEAPVRLPSAEQALQGSRLDDGILADAGKAAMLDVDPISDHRASADYRKAMTGVLMQRALARVRERMHQEA